MRKTTRKRILRWVLGLVVVYTLAGFFLLPWLVKTVLLWQLPKQLGRQVALQKVRFNPFTLHLALEGFVIREPNGDPFVAWDAVAVTMKPSALVSRTIALPAVTISNAYAHVQSNQDGSFNFSDILARFPTAPAKAEATGKPWIFRVSRFQMTGSRVAYDDFSRATPFRTIVGPISIQLENFSTNPDHRNPYGFTAITESGEKFSWRGFFHLAPIRSSGEFTIENIVLNKYAPYYDEFVNLKLNTGTLDVRAGYRVEFTDRLTTAQLTNLHVALRSLEIADKDSTNIVCQLPELIVADAALDLPAQLVNVGTCSVRGLRLDVRRLDDGRLNLLNLLASVPATTNAPATNAPAAWVATVQNVAITDCGAQVTGFFGEQQIGWQALAIAGVEARAAPTPSVRVDSIVLTNGMVAFTDPSVAPPAAMSLNRLNATIKGLASDANAVADLRVDGRVDNAAPIEVAGRINPLNLDAATAMQVAFKDVSLLPLGPYAGKYLGYLLRKGKLSLDLKYDIQQRALKAENNIRVDQFTFGEATGSPDAVKLPVKLAVAILKDRNGLIELDVPVEGRVDDPQFRYWGAVWRVLGNLFTKILTAPFSALGSMFGGGGEELAYQEFAPGSAELSPEQTAKLDVLIKALTERPGLNLELTGAVDPVQDVAPLQREKLKALAFARIGNTNDYVGGLRLLYAEALPQVAPPPAPPKFATNVINLRLKSATPPRGTAARKAAADLTVEELERQYLPLVALTEDDYRPLAAARVARVVAYLKEKGQLAADRLFVANHFVKDGARVMFGLQ